MNRLVERFLFESQDTLLPPRFNIAPSQPVAALRRSDRHDSRQLCLLRWGLIPSWATDPAIGYKLINARSETVSEKPSFRSAFRHRRCLILTDGYFEWRQLASSKQKQPYYIRMDDDQPFALAGLWESWQAPDGAQQETCTIITTEANELTQPIHPRMPVILSPDNFDRWLAAPETEAASLQPLLRPFPSDAMTLFPVSTLVNSPKNQSAECIVPTDASEDPPPRQQELF